MRKYEITKQQLTTYSNRIIVAGSRTYTDYKQFVQLMDEYSSKLNQSTTAYISGNASRGADAMLIHWAELRRKPYCLFTADWDKNKRIAGFIRNQEMAENGTHLFVVYDGESSGSRNMIWNAKKRNLNNTVVLFNKDDQPQESLFPHAYQKDISRTTSSTGFTFRSNDSN